jgi:hypothetical protein
VGIVCIVRLDASRKQGIFIAKKKLASMAYSSLQHLALVLIMIALMVSIGARKERGVNMWTKGQKV